MQRYCNYQKRTKNSNLNFYRENNTEIRVVETLVNERDKQFLRRHPLELMFQRWWRGDGRQASIKKLLNAA